jgi:hypothetical protein
LYSSPDIRVIKSRRDVWDIQAMINMPIYKILVRKCDGARLSRRWKITLNSISKKEGVRGVDWIHLTDQSTI